MTKQSKKQEIENLSYVWRKGKRKIVVEITPLDEHYLFQREMDMLTTMGLSGWVLSQSNRKEKDGEK